ncbi:MAG: amino acid ABC transporter substrate-binding protein [Hormoscilla sp. GM102CHS1]|nr:amino acid ABC transporter substrate-binding protein [Hormoscilla sp. GM102CHS1]
MVRALAEYEKAGLAMVSPTSTSTTLSGRVFFRTVPSDAVSGTKLAEYAKNQLGKKRVAVFYNPNSSYSSSLKEAFVGRFQPLGGNAQIIDMNDADLNVEQEVRKLQDKDADAIVLFPNTSLISVSVAIARANRQQMLMLGGDALYRPQTLTSGGNAVEGLILAVPWFAQTTYAQKAEQRWGGQVSWRTATSYDATRALIQSFSENASRKTVLDNLQYTYLPGSETSGSELQFQPTGDRVGEPILVKVRRGRGGPVGSQFSFQPISPW